MSTWGIGDNHDSDQVSILKDQIRTKDAQYANLQNQLYKRDEALNENKTSFNDMLYKLRNEADRVVQLEATLSQRNEEIQNERVTRQNTEAALTSSQQKLKSHEQATRELNGTLESLSSHAHHSSSDKANLERENAALQTRVRELQAEAHAREQREQVLLCHSQSAAGASSHKGGRRRSSSVSTFRVTALEQETSDLRTRSSQQSSEIHALTERLARTQQSLVQVQNEKTATERQLHRQLEEARSTLEEREEDLKAMREMGASEDVVMREAGLLERLEDEEGRVAALESQLAHANVSHKGATAMLTEELDRVQQLLAEERKRGQELEARMIELIGEKEEAFGDRKQAQRDVLDLDERVESANSQIKELESMLSASTLLPRSPTAGSGSPDPETAAIVQRLLGAIERLRGQRDTLREECDRLHRDFDFVKAETKFTVRDLETKLAVALASTPAADHTKREDEVSSLQQRLGELQARLSDSERRIAELSLAAHQTEAQREESFSRTHILVQDLTDAHTRLDDAQKAVQERDALVARTNEMVMELDAATEDLQAAQSQVSALKQTTQRLEEELSQERNAHEETSTTLAQTEAQLADISQSLGNAEAARDALSLQLKHTEQDLHAAREELVEADTRYGQQLCAISTGQATRAFREQIEAMEERVLRRTEQIGLHQHDIKRLETNLRLHEERLTEMTNELEVVQGQKDAMIEDCRVTREERDEAMRKCEELDEIAEQSEQDREREIQAMVVVVFSAVARQRAMAREIRGVVERHAAESSELKTRLREADDYRARVGEEAGRLVDERDGAARLLEEKTRLLQTLREEKELSAHEARTTANALATLQAKLQDTMSSSRATEEERSTAQSQLTTLQQEVSDKADKIYALHDQLEALGRQHTNILSDNASRSAHERAELEQELTALRDASAEAQSRHQQEVEKLVQDLETLRIRLADSDSHSHAEALLRDKLAQLQEKYSVEMDELKDHHERVSAELSQEKRLHDEMISSHDQAERELVRSKEDLEGQLAEATAKLQLYVHADGELAEVEARYEAQLAELQERLDHAMADLDAATTAHDEVNKQQRAVAERLENYLAESELLEAQLLQLQSDHADELRAMQDRLALANTEIAAVRKTHSELDIRHREVLQELSRAKDDLARSLASTTEEIEDLKADLDAERDAHSRAVETHEFELQSADARRMTAEMNGEKLAEELAGVRATLDEVDVSLQAAQEEKEGLQFEITNLEADIQRSKSLQRYLESQLKDSEREVSSLKEELEQAQTKAVQSEKACRAAEVNLSMQVIQSEQTLTSLRRDLSNLKASPKLQDEVVDLKEQNLEMEQLLRSKCIEIEENDDRFIELLKEKKKLNSKIDSLTRKVHSLQTKLASASVPGSVSTPTEPTHQVASQRASSKSTTPPPIAGPSVPSIPSRSTYTPSTPRATSRVASTSTVPRPKTPEARVSQPVFRMHTPEAKRTGPPQPIHAPYLMESSSSSSSIGKKRRAPDDFDGCEGVPPQGFTADSMPSIETSTPRMRRTTVRTAFTPVRNTVRADAPPASPIRRATTSAPMSAAAIADVTNSPRGKHQADAQTAKKRGWLGKIRPAPAPAPRAVSSRAPLFERR